MLLNVVISVPFAVRGVTADPVAWGAVALLGVFQIGLAYALFSIGIRITPPLAASLIAAVEPILSPVWVAVFRHELPGPLAIAGGVVVLLAVVGYNALGIYNTRRAPQDSGPPPA
jgi:drug/metabolite transporter (DMT)-like permease